MSTNLALTLCETGPMLPALIAAAGERAAWREIMIGYTLKRDLVFVSHCERGTHSYHRRTRLRHWENVY